MTTQQDLRQKQKNAAFNKLKKCEKRVLIAKDALKRIKAKKYRPTKEIYVKFSQAEAWKIKKDLDAQKACSSVSCAVCARGALFLSQINCSNNLKTSSLFSSEYSLSIDLHPLSGKTELLNYEEKIWSNSQLGLIEAAFERSYLGRAVDLPDDQVEVAKEFTKNIPNIKKRLIAILKNIIKNNGTFVP